VQGVIELLGSIHIIQLPSEGRKPTRVGAALTQRLAALREDLEAASAAVLPSAAPTSTASRQPSDAVLRELEGYVGQRPKVWGLEQCCVPARSLLRCLDEQKCSGLVT